jgi:glycosyltransferase involved in cell wall biosynthesis
MKVAIVHDWLVTWAGAERVLEQMLALFPDADLYTLIDFLPPDQRPANLPARLKTSFLQRLPFARIRYRQYLPLMPLAVEQFDLSGYDLVLSSSYAVAKGVLTGPEQLHISYVHSPMRYAWDLQHQYLRESGLDRGLRQWFARWVLHKMRLWDARTSNGVDHFVANSHFIARRIEKTYRRSSVVIHPPVDVATFRPGGPREDFYLTASRLVPYKRVDLVVEAFSLRRDRRLVVIGEGPEHRHIRSGAGSNIEFLGYQKPEILKDYMQRARAFLFAGQEDFGIVLLEAQACGVPVIAYGSGGARESVRHIELDRPTGVLFWEQTAQSLTRAIERFEREGDVITPDTCRDNALRFAPERFRAEFFGYVTQAWTEFQERPSRIQFVPRPGSARAPEPMGGEPGEEADPLRRAQRCTR